MCAETPRPDEENNIAIKCDINDEIGIALECDINNDDEIIDLGGQKNHNELKGIDVAYECDIKCDNKSNVSNVSSGQNMLLSLMSEELMKGPAGMLLNRGEDTLLNRGNNYILKVEEYNDDGSNLKYIELNDLENIKIEEQFDDKLKLKSIPKNDASSNKLLLLCV
eukprot:53072_1